MLFLVLQLTELLLPKRSFRLLFSGLLMFTSTGHAFDYEDLVDLINSKNITAIEQVLSNLPDEYLESYTLVHHSRSLHGASHDFPRAILFGKDAKLMLTFNGSAGQRRYNDLEIMQFRDEASVFELRSVSFENGVRFSHSNPALCLGCHGADPRPIWSSYEYSEDKGVVHWPGFYGSTHDAPVLNGDEKAAFDRFRARAKTHPRYRFLKLRHPGSQWYPYGAGPFKHQFRPNNRLGNLLARLNAKRLARHLRRGAFYGDYPSLSMLWVLQCPEISNDPFMVFIEDRFRRQYPNLGNVLKRLSGARERVAFMLEKLLLGPTVFTWNMSLEPTIDEPRFFTGIVHIDELVAAELLGGMPRDHWLRDFYTPWTQRELYDTFKPGYYDANVAPGGVGEDYDSVGVFYDRDHARGACQELLRQASSEIDY